MSARGSITLGELRGKLDILEVWCHRCDRRGRVSVAHLIAEHGAGMGLPELRDILAGDCSCAQATAIQERCGVFYPQLPMLFSPSPRRWAVFEPTNSERAL